VTTEVLAVRVEHNPVLASDVDTDSVVGIALRGVEIEDKHNACPFKDNDLVSLVLKRDVGLWSVQPTIFLLALVHLAIKVVEERVAKQSVLCQVELPACIPKRILVALTRKVKPLRMAKFVALKVEVAFATEPVGEKTDHLM
jgi:hypothetical protein